MAFSILNTSLEEYEKSLNDLQREYYNAFKSGSNLFITGNAGTGKTHLVDTIIKHCEDMGKNMFRLAPTGIASTHIDGETIHHAFKLDIKPQLVDDSQTYTNKLLKHTNVVIIDEISMVRIDIFDVVAKYIFDENKSRISRNMPTIQLVVIGDFYQLPPVISNMKTNKNDKEELSEKEILNKHYGKDIKGGYAFQSKYWKTFDFKFCKLTEVVRQKDIDFCKSLDLIKMGNASGLNYVRKECIKDNNDDFIFLGCTNATVDEINKRKLDNINDKTHYSYAEFSKKEKDSSITEKSFSVPSVLEFKKGARVIITINDNEEGLYKNGSMGTITDYGIENVEKWVTRKEYANSRADLFSSIRPTEDFEWIEFASYEDYPDKIKVYSREEVITVFLDNGYKVSIAKHTYELKKNYLEEYEETITKTVVKDGKEKKVKEKVKKKKIKTKTIATMTQFPIKLGYAITIHKSQGMTISELNLLPERMMTFSNMYGLLYVALSRCEDVKKLHLQDNLNDSYVHTADEVVKFYNDPENYSFFGEENEMVTLDGIVIPKALEKEIKKYIKKRVEEFCNDNKSVNDETSETKPLTTFKSNGSSSKWVMNKISS